MKLLAFYIALLITMLAPSLPDAPPANDCYPDDSTNTSLRILGADELRRDEQDGEPVRLLTGNVRICQEDTKLWANRVIEYLERDEVLLLGNVVIVERGDTLNARRVLYNKTRKEGRATGDVRLSDGEVQVFAPSAIYFNEEKRTLFEETVRLVDSVTVLTSQKGEYFSDEKRAEFAHDVVLDEDRTHLKADSVTYFRDTEISIGRGSVFIERIGGDEDEEPDSTLRTFLYGDYAFNNNRNGYSRIEGQALMIQFKLDSTATDIDTLMMAASRLEAQHQDSLQRLTAVDSVRIWRHSFAALADSAVYDRIEIEGLPLEEDNRLFESPIAWYEGYQISGDSIRASAAGGSVDSLWVLSNAFTAQLDSVLNRINQLKGDFALGLFEQDSLKSLSTWPQAEAIFHMADENNALSKAVKASGDSLIFMFENNEPKRFKFDSGVEGTSYPGPLIPELFQLDGYLWTPERRPDKPSLLILLPEQHTLPEILIEMPEIPAEEATESSASSNQGR